MTCCLICVSFFSSGPTLLHLNGAEGERLQCTCSSNASQINTSKTVYSFARVFKKQFQHFASLTSSLLLFNFCSGEIKLWGAGGHKRGGVGGSDDGEGSGGLMGGGG